MPESTWSSCTTYQSFEPLNAYFTHLEPDALHLVGASVVDEGAFYAVALNSRDKAVEISVCGNSALMMSNIR